MFMGFFSHMQSGQYTDWEDFHSDMFVGARQLSSVQSTGDTRCDETVTRCSPSIIWSMRKHWKGGRRCVVSVAIT